MRLVRPSCGMAKSVLRIETEAVAEGCGRGCGLPSRQLSTVLAYVMAPVSNTVTLRLGTSFPALSCSTVSHEPRVKLNSMRPRTEVGSVISYAPPSRRVRIYAGAAGSQRLKEPATVIGTPIGVLAGTRSSRRVTWAAEDVAMPSATAPLR